MQRRDLLKLSPLALASTVVGHVAYAKTPVPSEREALFNVRTYGATGDGKTLDFDPGGDFPQASRDAIDQRENHSFNWPSGSLTRAQAAVLICEQLGLPL